MKSLLLAGAMILAAGNSALADYWVVGNRASGGCDIVTSNPVINAQVGGNTTFGSGPYRSLDDAKIARSTTVLARRWKSHTPPKRRMTRNRRERFQAKWIPVRVKKTRQNTSRQSV